MTRLQLISFLVAALKEMAPVKKPTIKGMSEKMKGEDINGADITEAWNQYQAELKQASDNGTSKNEDVDGVIVRAAPGVGGFRRAGYRFDEAGTGFALDVFTDEELDSFDNEKRLVVEYVTFTADDTYIAE